MTAAEMWRASHNAWSHNQPKLAAEFLWRAAKALGIEVEDMAPRQFWPFYQSRVLQVLTQRDEL